MRSIFNFKQKLNKQRQSKTTKQSTQTQTQTTHTFATYKASEEERHTVIVNIENT